MLLCLCIQIMIKMKAHDWLHAADQPGSRPQHTLELCFSDANSTIQKATLQPADVEIDSIVKVAAVGRQGVSFVVCHCMLLAKHCGSSHC